MDRGGLVHRDARAHLKKCRESTVLSNDSVYRPEGETSSDERMSPSRPMMHRRDLIESIFIDFDRFSLDFSKLISNEGADVLTNMITMMVQFTK